LGLTLIYCSILSFLFSFFFDLFIHFRKEQKWRRKKGRRLSPNPLERGPFLSFPRKISSGNMPRLSSSGDILFFAVVSPNRRMT
jgi:hypothetical protein